MSTVSTVKTLKICHFSLDNRVRCAQNEKFPGSEYCTYHYAMSERSPEMFKIILANMEPLSDSKNPPPKPPLYFERVEKPTCQATIRNGDLPCTSLVHTPGEIYCRRHRNFGKTKVLKNVCRGETLSGKQCIHMEHLPGIGFCLKHDPNYLLEKQLTNLKLSLKQEWEQKR